MEKKINIDYGESYHEDKLIDFGQTYMQHGLVGSQKRLFIACMAMQGLLALPESSYPPGTTFYEIVKCIVKSSYEYADEMLKQEYKKEEKQNENK